MTKTEAVEKLLNTARAEIGYHEGANNYIKYAENHWDNEFYGWDLQNQPWCDVFVDYCFIFTFGMTLGALMTYQPVGSGSALCSRSAIYFKNNNAFFTYPEPGDQIFFYANGDINHTGIVESVTGDKNNWTNIITIEGNSSDSVARRTYQRGNAKITGFGRPNWNLVANETEKSTATSTITNTPTTEIKPKEDSTILRKGDKGELVRQLQKKLIQLNYSCGPDGADGDFGENTLKAVLQFQREYGLEPDGEVGPLTNTMLNKALEKVDVFTIGEIIKFIGDTYYSTPIVLNGHKCTPGQAKIIRINKHPNVKHPYFIKHIDNNSDVNGWVDSNKIKSI